MPSQRSPAWAAQLVFTCHSSCAKRAMRRLVACSDSSNSVSSGTPSCRVRRVWSRRRLSSSKPLTKLCSFWSSLLALPLSVTLRSRLLESSSMVRSNAPARLRSCRSEWFAPRASARPPLSSRRRPSPTRVRQLPFRRAEVKRLSLAVSPTSYKGGVLPMGCCRSKRNFDSARVVNSTGTSISMSPPSPRHCRRDVRFRPMRLSSLWVWSTCWRVMAPLARSSSTVVVVVCDRRRPLKAEADRL